MLVAIILFLFLGDLRSAVVVILALPLAMLIAFILMQYVGLSANLMSLAGLAIGIGMMVDGAVVMVENGYRLLSHAGPTADRNAIIAQAAREVVNPIAFAILIIIVVFLPLFGSAASKASCSPMALTITFAMVGSLVLTMTLIPVLAALILRARGEEDTFLLRGIKRVYLPLLERRWRASAWPRPRRRPACGRPRAVSAARQGVHAAAAGGNAAIPGDGDPLDLAR
jgi:cobalt-zinc-cadmium resistance protein CzcA